MRSLLFLAALLAAPLHADVLVVASSGASHVTLIDPLSLEALSQVPVGKGPHEVTVSADGLVAWVADSGSKHPDNTITVVDLRARTAAKRLPLENCASPHDLAVARGGNPLWVTCAPAKTVLELDAWTGATRRRWELGQEGAWMLAAAGDGTRVFTANLEGGSMSAIDRKSGAVTTLKTAAGEIGIAVAPGDRMLWLTNANTGAIVEVDTATSKIRHTFASGGDGPVRVRFTPDGKRAVVTYGGAPKAAIFDVTTRTAQKWIDLEGAPKVVAVSPDGRRAAMSIPALDRVAIVDLTAPHAVRYVDVAGKPDGVAWARTPEVKTRSKVAFTIPDRELIPEGIAFDPKSGAFFVGSTNQRKIVRIDAKGRASDFTSEGQDGMWGLVGMTVDAARRELWAANSHAGEDMPMRQMPAADRGKSALHVYDVDSGRFLRRYDAPAANAFLNDLVLTPNGDAYVTDTINGSVLRVRRGAAKLEPFAQGLRGPNGIAFDAKKKRLYVAGWRILYAIDVADANVADAKVHEVKLPEHVWPPGTDGLAFHDNTLLTVQPWDVGRHISRYALDATGLAIRSAETLEAGHESLEQPTTGVVSGDAFFVIANSHLQTFRAGKRELLRDVVVLRVPLR